MTTPTYGCLVCIPGTFTCPDCHQPQPDDDPIREALRATLARGRRVAYHLDNSTDEADQ